MIYVGYGHNLSNVILKTKIQNSFMLFLPDQVFGHLTFIYITRSHFLLQVPNLQKNLRQQKDLTFVHC